MSMHHMNGTSGGHTMMNHSVTGGHAGNMTSTTSGHVHHHMTSTTAHMHQGGPGSAGNPHAAHDNPSQHTMFFHTAYSGLAVLFEELELHDEKSLLYACLALFAVSVLYEGLKVGRELLNNSCSRISSRSALYRSKEDVHFAQNKRCSGRSVAVHVLQSFLHIVQVSVSYMLMLAVMTFNVYICLAIVLGAGVGYLLFAWKRQTVEDVNEHCN